MVTLYKKVDKTKENLYGFDVLNKDDIPLLKPTMICLSAQASYSKSIFGIVREGMRAARLRTSQGVAGKYALNDFPINFVGVHYDYKGNGLGNDLAQDYFLPLISQNGQKINIKQAKQNMHNLTIMTYCDGILEYFVLEETLTNLMQEIGYTSLEIKEILQELTIIGVLTMRDMANCLATSFQIVDVNDNEIFDEATPSLIESLQKQETNHDFIKTSDNSGIYYFNGNGEHSIKSLFKDNYLPHALIVAIVSQSLTRSIDKRHEFSFDNMQEMIASIINHYQVGYAPNEILKDLDEQIYYPGSRKLSNFECEYLDIIDELSRKTKNYENDIKILKSHKARLEESYQRLEIATKSTVSELEYMLILQKTGYQFSQEDLDKITNYENKKKIG